MKSLKHLILAAALAVASISPALAASDLVLSTGITFPPGFRLHDGTDLNTVLGAVNTLADQADGTTAGVWEGPIGGTTPAAGAFTTLGATGAATLDAAATVGTTLGVTGVTTTTGGIAGSLTASNIFSCGNPPLVSTDGTDTTPATTETYISPVFVPTNMTITGVAVFSGTAVTDNLTVGLATAAGAPIAAAISADTLDTGADAFQRVPFAVPYVAVGPAMYWVQLQYDGTTSRFNSYTFGNCPVTKQTAQTYGVMTSFTPPTTFTTAVGPMVGLY